MQNTASYRLNHQDMTVLTCLAIVVAAPRPWTLVAGGDIMFYAMSPKRPALTAVREMFRQADVAYANLEVPLTDANTATKRKTAADVKAKRQFILKGSPLHASELKAAGFDLLSLGNNHAMDYGPQGLAQMTKLMAKQQIATTGAGTNAAEAERLAVTRTKSGVRVGMLSYLAFMGRGAMEKCTPATQKFPGVAILDFGGTVGLSQRALLKQKVAAARKQCDVLLVALHWGIERQTHPTPYQMALGRAWIDAGADAVLGAHPHTLQGREIYRGKPILYSMGNLISPLPAQSAVYTLRFSDREFLGWDVRPMDNRGGKAVWLTPAKEKARRKALLALDFPGKSSKKS